MNTQTRNKMPTVSDWRKTNKAMKDAILRKDMEKNMKTVLEVFI